MQHSNQRLPIPRTGTKRMYFLKQLSFLPFPPGEKSQTKKTFLSHVDNSVNKYSPTNLGSFHLSRRATTNGRADGRTDGRGLIISRSPLLLLLLLFYSKHPTAHHFFCAWVGGHISREKGRFCFELGSFFQVRIL